MVHNAEFVTRREFTRELARLVKRFESLSRRHAILAQHVRNIAGGKQYYNQKTKPRYRKFTVQKAVQLILKEIGASSSLKDAVARSAAATDKKARRRNEASRISVNGGGRTQR